jgi:hypothetical protein
MENLNRSVRGNISNARSLSELSAKARFYTEFEKLTE